METLSFWVAAVTFLWLGRCQLRRRVRRAGERAIEQAFAGHAFENRGQERNLSGLIFSMISERALSHSTAIRGLAEMVQEPFGFLRLRVTRSSHSERGIVNGLRDNRLKIQRTKAAYDTE